MTNHWSNWRLTPVRPILAVAALSLAAPAGAIALTHGPAQPSQPVRTAQAPTAKPQPPLQQFAQVPARPPATEGGSEPRLVGQYGDWGVYSANPGGKKVCFALAKPVKAWTEPPNRKRDPAYLFISSRPADQVKDEVSVMFGYPTSPNRDASVEISGANFAVHTQADGGWVKNAAEEPRLVESMRKGMQMTVKGFSARGAKTFDVYSLKGVSKALDRVAQECRN